MVLYLQEKTTKNEKGKSNMKDYAHSFQNDERK